jgi:hypothetical protein
MTEKPLAIPETKLPNEILSKVETAKKIASPDFFENGVNHQGRLIKPARGKSTNAEEVNKRFIFVGSGEERKKITLTGFLEQSLPGFAYKLPKDIKSQLVTQGLLQEKDGQLVWPEEIKPEQKLQVLSAVASFIKDNGLDDFCPKNIAGGDFITGLQALSLQLAKEAYENYQPGTLQEEKEISYKRKKKAAEDRLKMSVAYVVGGESPEIAVEREMIFSVNKENKVVIDGDGQTITFPDLLNKLRQAKANGNYKEMAQIPSLFFHVLEQSPSEAQAIISRLKRELSVRLSSPQTSVEDKQEIQALLGIPSEKFNQESFNHALNTLFKLEPLTQSMQSQDKNTRTAAFEEYYRQIWELGAVIFGTEGLQRLVEVDLRIAVGLSDILLPEEARLARIQLEQQLKEAKDKARQQANDDPRLQKVLGKLVLADKDYQKIYNQLSQTRQTQQEAILYAFGVKFEDRTPVIANPSEEVKQLASQIRLRYEKLMESDQLSILEANRQMIIAMLQSQGLNLSKEQKNKFFTALSNRERKSSEAIIDELGIDRNNPSFSLIRAIIADGNRVNTAVCSLGKKVIDSYSQVEDLTIEGDILVMGLKGVEYLYRHGRFDEEEIKEKIVIPGKPSEKPLLTLPEQVPIYETIQTEATIQAQPTEPESTQAEAPAEETPQEAAAEEGPLTVKQVSQKVQGEEIRGLEGLQQKLPEAQQKLSSFDTTSIESLAAEIYARGVGQKSLREVGDETRKLGETQVLLPIKASDGKVQIIDVTQELSQMEFEIEKPSGERGKVRLSPEAISHSPELAKELMKEVLARKAVKTEKEIMDQPTTQPPTEPESTQAEAPTGMQVPLPKAKKSTKTPEEKRFERLATLDENTLASDRRRRENLQQRLENVDQLIQSINELETVLEKQKQILESLQTGEEPTDDVEEQNQEKQYQENIREIRESISKIEKEITNLRRLANEELIREKIRALEEKERLRELVTGLREAENRQIAKRDWEEINKTLGEVDLQVLELSQTVLSELNRSGAFQMDMARFDKVAQEIAYQLEQQAGWNPDSHETNVEAVKRALLFYAASNPPQLPASSAE